MHTDEAKRLISQAGRGRRPANAYSKYLGVSFDKRRNHWVAYITIDRKNKFIGNFPTEIDAAKARDKIAQLFWGSKAILNFPASKQETYQALINLNQLNSIISKIRIEARIQSRKIFKSKNNSSQYLGVCYIKQRSKWSATIRVNGKVKFLGHFDDEILAAKAYDRIAKKLKRNDALLNFPDIKQEA